MIDLGEWASEAYRVPVEDAKPGEEPDPSGEEKT